MMYRLKRTVTKAECPWLSGDIQEGTEVHRFYGHTYGVCSDMGIPVTRVPDEHPFFELPADALETVWAKPPHGLVKSEISS